MFRTFRSMRSDAIGTCSGDSSTVDNQKDLCRSRATIICPVSCQALCSPHVCPNSVLCRIIEVLPLFVDLLMPRHWKIHHVQQFPSVLHFATLKVDIVGNLPKLFCIRVLGHASPCFHSGIPDQGQPGTNGRYVVHTKT